MLLNKRSSLKREMEEGRKEKRKEKAVSLPRTNFHISTINHLERFKDVVLVWPLTLLPPQICTGQTDGSGTATCTRATCCSQVIRNAQHEDISCAKSKKSKTTDKE